MSKLQKLYVSIHAGVQAKKLGRGCASTTPDYPPEGGCLQPEFVIDKGQADSTVQSDIEDICKRLVDSEEHAVEAAVPDVAFEAAEVIKRLSGALKATQSTLSQTMQYAEKTDKFVHQVGALSIWEYDQNDGTPYDECDEPDDGFLDSHTCLMGLIEQARALQGGK